MLFENAWTPENTFVDPLENTMRQRWEVKYETELKLGIVWPYVGEKRQKKPKPGKRKAKSPFFCWNMNAYLAKM